MIQSNITSTIIDAAKLKANDLGLLNNSITNGDGNIVAFIGEEIVKSIFNAKSVNTYNYDLILPNGKTVDVKTKRTNVKPKNYYECSVAAFNTKQQCDYYAFVRVMNNNSLGWFLGIISKEEYFKKAKFLNMGDVDPDNNFIVKADCYNLKISELYETI